jgi:hypothetical protein
LRRTLTPAADTGPVHDALDEQSVETRTLLGLSVSANSLARLLPRGWSVSPASQGPASANLYVMVADRLLVQSTRGRAIGDQSDNRLAVIAVPAVAEGAAGLVITAGYSARPADAPGYYRVFAVAEFAFERRLVAGDRVRVEERWRIDGADGAKIRIELDFVRGLPVRSESRTWAYSAVDPSIRRLYVADQGTDVLQSEGTANERLESVSIEAHGALFDPLFDGSERLVSVMSLPWSVRHAFVSAAA